MKNISIQDIQDTNINHKFIKDENELNLYTKTGDLFQHPSWRKSIVEGNGYQCLGLITHHNDKSILTIQYTTKKGVFRLVGSPLPGSFIAYLNPIYLSSIDNEVLTRILVSQFEFLIKKKFSYIQWRLNTEIIDPNHFRKIKNIKIDEMGTFLLKIDPDEDTMWMRMESRGRNMVRKAIKKGVQIKKLQGSQREIELFYEMLKATFERRRKTPPHSFKLYKSLITNLAEANRLLFLSAKVEGKIVAMGIFPFDNRMIYFMSGASIPIAGKYAANNLLQWYVIKFAIEKGLKFYDLGGTGIPSIDRFKKSFGGTPYKYLKITWKTPLAAIAERSFLKLRTSFDRLFYKQI